MQQPQTPGRSWLGSSVFAFTTLYLALSTSTSLVSATTLLFFGIGILGSMLIVDLPAYLCQLKLRGWCLTHAAPDALDRAKDKAAALGTFIKAAQVVIAFAACKYAFMALLFS